MIPSVRQIRVAVILALSIHARAQDQIASTVDDFIKIKPSARYGERALPLSKREEQRAEFLLCGLLSLGFS